MLYPGGQVPTSDAPTPTSPPPHPGAGRGNAGLQSAGAFEIKGGTHFLGPDEILFKEGSAKTGFYRVEAGAIEFYRERSDHGAKDIASAFPGDVIGYGYLPTNVFSTRAICVTRLRHLPLHAKDTVLREDPRAMAAMKKAVEQEFRVSRTLLAMPVRRTVVERLAAFFVSQSRSNQLYGRDPMIISSAWQCSELAGLLNTTLEAFAAAAMELSDARLIEIYGPDQLRLTDVDALRRLAGLSPPPAPKFLPA